MRPSPVAELSRAFMDDEHEPGLDPDEDEGGSARTPTSRRRAVAKGGAAPNGSRGSSGGGKAPATARPRRWWEQPWLWGLVIVVVIGGALGVSLLVNTDPDDITPSGDTAAFCAAARSYKDVRDSVDPARTGEASAADDASLRAALANLQQASPPEIRATTDEVLAALDRVIQVQKESATAGTAIDPASAAEAKLAAIDAGVQRASIRLTNYAKKACGIDLGAAPTTVPTTRPIGPVPADNEPGTVEPGVSASLVTPS